MDIRIEYNRILFVKFVLVQVIKLKKKLFKTRVDNEIYNDFV